MVESSHIILQIIQNLTVLDYDEILEEPIEILEEEEEEEEEEGDFYDFLDELDEVNLQPMKRSNQLS
jgi:hypothetical protein